MFSKSYETRLLEQCSPTGKKYIMSRPEYSDRFIPCRVENNWKTSFQGNIISLYFPLNAFNWIEIKILKSLYKNNKTFLEIVVTGNCR